MKETAPSLWLADLTHTQQQLAAELIPYGVGCIAANLENSFKFPQPIRIFKYPEVLIEAIESDGIPDVVGFSNYVWNTNLASEIAIRIKQLKPEVTIVFGGPNYPVQSEDRREYLECRPEIDFYVVFEGEITFANLLREIGSAKLQKEKLHGRVEGVHSIDSQGEFHEVPLRERVSDLSPLPSPYLNGMLDEFFDGRLLPIVQFKRGCPFSCTFCCEGDDYFNKVRSHGLEKLSAELEYIAERVVVQRDQGGRNDLGIADSNFGMFKDDSEFAAVLSKLQSKYQWPEYIHVATGKNQKHRVLNTAKALGGALRLSGSVQSLDPEALKNVRRSNIAPDDLLDLAKDAAEIQANSYSETILGLPGETKSAHYDTLRQLMDADFDRVISYQLMMLPGTDLNTKKTRRKYQMDIRYRVLPRCFGSYGWSDKPVISAEIEEICVANSTLSFDDYLECRKTHLMISIFYNDGVFAGLLKFLKQRQIPIFSWVETLRDSAGKNQKLRKLMEEFENATREELWEDREQLRDYIRSEGVIDRYVSGDLGANLMLSFKAISMTEFVDDLAEVARDASQKLLLESNNETPHDYEFLENVISYDVGRMSRIWTDHDSPSELRFGFDVQQFLADSTPLPLQQYHFSKPITFRFSLSDEQKLMIGRYFELFGSDLRGISRILSKTPTKRLMREAKRLV